MTLRASTWTTGPRVCLRLMDEEAADDSDEEADDLMAASQAPLRGAHVS